MPATIVPPSRTKIANSTSSPSPLAVEASARICVFEEFDVERIRMVLDLELHGAVRQSPTICSIIERSSK